MSAKRECTICKHYGKKTPEGDVEKANVYDEVGTPVTLHLCRNHAVELFKSGQKRFMLQHHKILVDIISSDETKFLDVLEKTIMKHLDEIY